VTDAAGNGPVSTSRVFSIDWTDPSVTINAPAASSWQTADFVVDVTNSDATSGTGTCQYRVESDSVETLAWTAYNCADNATATVGVGNYCDVEGADKCEVFLRVTDAAGNGPVSTSRVFSIDWTDPSVTINAPAASSWQTADFVVDVTNSDATSGPGTCQYRIESDSVETLAWTAYNCADNATATVGVGDYCDVEGADMCEVFLRITDVAGNGFVSTSRVFGIDWTNPSVAIVAPAASSWQSVDFVVDVTNSDATSGPATCQYRIESDSVETLAWTAYNCADNATATVGVGNYCDVEGADMCEVFLRITDVAGNGPVSTSRVFGIDWTNPSVAIVAPAASSWQTADFVVDVTNSDATSGPGTCQYRIESDGVETLAWTAYGCGTDPTITVGAGDDCDVEGADKCEVFLRVTDVAGNGPVSTSRVFSIDWTNPSVAINAPAASSDQTADFTLDATNADATSGTALCQYRVESDGIETLAWTVYDCATDPTITVGPGDDCDVEGADKCEVFARVTDVAGNGPVSTSRLFGIVLVKADRLVLSALGEYIVTTDYEYNSTSWCSGGGCAPACALGNYCSQTAAVSAKPDFVKLDDGSGSVALENIADDSTPAAGEWSWDSANNRVVLFDDPGAPGVAVYATVNGGSETVCVQLKDTDGNNVVIGAASGATVEITLSQAPDSGKDVTANAATADQGFANITVPVADLSEPEQTVIRGDLIKGKACFVVTAETLPSDDPKP